MRRFAAPFVLTVFLTGSTLVGVRSLLAPEVPAPRPHPLEEGALDDLTLPFIENRGQLPAHLDYYLEGPRGSVVGPEGAGVTTLLADVPLSFEENGGQVSADVDYFLHGSDASVGFSPDGVILSLEDRGGTSQRWALRLGFLGARRVPPVGVARTPTMVSYFKGQPQHWVTGLSTFSKVEYPDLWPGIDLVYSGTGARLKYSLVVHPGADPGNIGLAYRGATDLRLGDRGQLEVSTPAGTLVEDAPFSYQVIGGRRVPVASSYALGQGSAFGFEVGAFDPSRALVIDPTVFLYAGFIGGSALDRGYDVAVDGTGAAYITGETASSQATFPDGDGVGALPGPDSSHNVNDDAFVAKVGSSGTSLVYAGYIGGSGVDEGHGIAVDAAGAAYVAGFTSSNETTFPDGDGFGTVTGPDTTLNGNSDAFVAKVVPSGTSLAYVGYIGGSGFELVGDIAVDDTGAAYVTGSTSSDQTTFPDGDGAPTGPDTTYNGGFDAFVAKVVPSGSSLAYAGYIGGSGFDGGGGIAVDGAEAAYLVGDTSSDQTTFPDGDGAPTGPDTTYNGGGDAFVAKVAPSGASLVSAGYIGGSTEDYGLDLAVDGAGAAYVTGFTDSTQATFPDGNGFGTVTGPDPTFNGAYDAYVAKVASSGASLEYAGYVGGSDEDEGRGIAVDGSGVAHVTGETESTQATFPDGDGMGTLPGPDPTHNGGDDAFVVQVDASGAGLSEAGYIGGSGFDIAHGIAMDAAGAAYVAGETSSSEGTFPDGDGLGALSGPDVTHNSAPTLSDAFLVKLAEPAPAAKCKGKAATLTGTPGNDNLTGTGGAEVIAALGGKDKVRSRGGKDLVCAGGGNDAANGGGGKDKLFGEGGKDKLKGGGDDDTLNGGKSQDQCAGGSGTDKAAKCETERGVP